MTPDFSIRANQNDITDTIRTRLLQLRVSDEAGLQSDTCEIVLDDREHRIEWPNHGAVLHVALGYKGQPLSPMGHYVIDEVTHQHPPSTLTIRGKAADMLASLKAPKTRSWSTQSIGQVVHHIANEHQLIAKVSSFQASILLHHVDQTHESDLHLLTRLAKQYDAVAKPANGFLLFVSKGEVKSATGKRILPVTITPSQLLDYRFTQADRGKYASVRTHWYDMQAATNRDIRSGQGEPTYTLRNPYSTLEEAQAAAQAKLKQLQRGEASLSFTLIGNTQLQAEGEIQLTGFRAPLNDRWLIQRVHHQLDANQGLVSRVDAINPHR